MLDILLVELNNPVIVVYQCIPECLNAPTLIKDCLLTLAEHLKPGAMKMLKQLKHDQTYMLKITPPVSVPEFEITSLTLLPSMCSYLYLSQQDHAAA